jgi:calcineurin-like phosphoesterase family protein
MLSGLITLDQDLRSVFVTADHHFGHANIIQYAGRPFADVEEMDQRLITNWNTVVKPTDTVYHLGDFTLMGHIEAERYFRRLNGHIFILSNEWHHDKRWLAIATRDMGVVFKSRSGAEFIVRFLPPMAAIEIPMLGKDGHPLAITLCHYPLAEWDRKHYGAWHLHGHSHGKHQGDLSEFMLDVGVDNTNYRPISLDVVLDIMVERGFGA